MTASKKFVIPLALTLLHAVPRYAEAGGYGIPLALNKDSVKVITFSNYGNSQKDTLLLNYTSFGNLPGIADKFFWDFFKLKPKASLSIDLRNDTNLLKWGSLFMEFEGNYSKAKNSYEKIQSNAGDLSRNLNELERMLDEAEYADQEIRQKISGLRDFMSEINNPFISYLDGAMKKEDITEQFISFVNAAFEYKEEISNMAEILPEKSGFLKDMGIDYASDAYQNVQNLNSNWNSVINLTSQTSNKISNNGLEKPYGDFKAEIFLYLHFFF